MKIHPPAGVRKIEMRYDEQNRRGRACLARKRRGKRRPYTWPIRRGAASGAPTHFVNPFCPDGVKGK